MKDRSLEEIDILKLFIYILIFIAVCGILIFFLLVPVLKEYKNLSLEQNSQIIHLAQTKEMLRMSEDKILNLRAENNKSLEQFEQKFNAQVFQSLLEKYFKEVQITEIKNPKENYLTHSFEIKANADSPNSLYNFLEDLNNFDYLVKINSPLLIKAVKEGIELKFNAKIYSSFS